MTSSKPSKTYLDRMTAAISFGGTRYRKLSTEEFNRAFDYILDCLKNSASLFENGAINFSLFLAITALEETAKIHALLYLSSSAHKERGRHPLADHNEKHALALSPTVFMSEELLTLLGEEVCNILQEKAQNSGFSNIREACLYCDFQDDLFITPTEKISLTEAWQILILAIETLDDHLIGYTDHTLAKNGEVRELFKKTSCYKPY